MTEAATRTPFVGQTVHYQSYGTPGGEYLPEPRAAIVTEVNSRHAQRGDVGTRVGLCVLNPTGMYFNAGVPFAETPTPGHWNYMPRTEAGDAVNTLVDEVCRISGWSGETVKGV